MSFRVGRIPGEGCDEEYKTGLYCFWCNVISNVPIDDEYRHIVTRSLYGWVSGGPVSNNFKMTHSRSPDGKDLKIMHQLGTCWKRVSGGWTSDQSLDEVCNECITHRAFCGDKTFNQCNYAILQGFGKVTINRSSFSRRLSYLGELIINNSEIARLHIGGKLQITDSKISNELYMLANKDNFCNKPTACKTHFMGPINHLTSLTTLNQCICDHGIKFKSCDSSIPTEMTLRLIQSTIKGSVVFENCLGKVEMDDQSKILGSLEGLGSQRRIAPQNANPKK